MGRLGRYQYNGNENTLRLEAVLTTHRHWDHAAGNSYMLRNIESCTRVYGGRLDQVPSCTHPLDDNDVVQVGNMRIRAVAAPGHTVGSMVYVLDGTNHDAMFTGDTLFCGGCGAPFEGDARSMSDWYVSCV